jgi:hypothetical protein
LDDQEILDSVVVDLNLSLDYWSCLKSGYFERHYLEGIECAGISLIDKVRDEFNTLASHLIQVCKGFILKKSLSVKETLFACFALNFWKIHFRYDDFKFLHAISIFDIFNFVEENSSLIHHKIHSMQNGIILNAFLSNSEQEVFLSPKSFFLSEMKSKTSRLGSRKSSLLKAQENLLHEYQLQCIDLCFNALNLNNLNSNESLCFRILSVLVIACSYENSPKELQVMGSFLPVAQTISKNPDFMKRLCDLTFDIIKPCYSKCKAVSPRTYRRVILIFVMVLRYADPLLIVSNFFKESGAEKLESLMDRFVAMLVSSLGYYSIGRFFDTDFNLISGIRSLKIKLIHQILRAISSQNIWRNILNGILSRHIENLVDVFSNLENNSKRTVEDILYLSVGSVLSLQADSGNIDIGSKVQYYGQGMRQKVQSGVVVNLIDEEATVLLNDDGEVHGGIELEYLRANVESEESSGSIIISDIALNNLLNFATIFPKRTRDRKVILFFQ